MNSDPAATAHGGAEIGAAAAMASAPERATLALFPLQTVLFPSGLLHLKVFEARYLDLVGRCLRERSPFGVVALQRGAEVRQAATEVAFERVGTCAEIMDVDSAQAGILLVRCRGMERFDIVSAGEQPDGLWVAEVTLIPADEALAAPASRSGTVKALADAIHALEGQGEYPFLVPHHLEDAGWVANRWCEILPIATAAKQRLLELRDPLARLEIVHEFLRTKGLVA